LNWWKWYMFRDSKLRTNYGYHWKNNVDNKVEDDIIYLEPVTRKETLASRTLHNFMVQLEKTTPKLFDAIRKVRDKLQLDLNFNQKNTIKSYFTKLS